MTTRAEAVIIGGGVIGCSILYHLAARGLTDAVLLERDVLGSGSTGRSSAPVYQFHSSETLLHMARQSLAVFQDFQNVIDGESGYTATGCLLLAGAAEADSFRSSVSHQRELGIETSLISPKEARELAPGLNLADGAVIAYEPQSGHADASATTFAYANRARQMGVRICLRAPVLSLETSAGGVLAVSTATERIETPVVVLATGSWSLGFLSRQGIDLPLRVGRKEVLALKRPPEAVTPHPGVLDFPNRIYFRPEGNDLTLVSQLNGEGTVLDPETYAHRASPGFIQDAWSRLAYRYPVMADAQFSSGYAGLVATTPDSGPILDRVEGVEGLYVCAGFGGHGVGLSPMAGKL
ncbi:MAG: NAD(P)/FAD-dependent oxidoreductase, partial [Dehalococcoidia bacterium]